MSLPVFVVPYYVDVPYFVNSSFDRHVGFFRLLAAVNEGIINISEDSAFLTLVIP